VKVDAPIGDGLARVIPISRAVEVVEQPDGLF
jgi:hypothetical protein